MSIYMKARDQIITLSSAVFEYDNQTRTHKAIIKAKGKKLLRISATEREPLKLAVVQALRGILTTYTQEATYPIDITHIILQAEKLYHPKDVQGYASNFSTITEGQSPSTVPTIPTIPTAQTKATTPLILVSESISTLKSQLFIHVLEGKTSVKVNQYNLSKGGNIFNIIFSNHNLTLASNNSLPVLKIEVDPQEIDNLAYKYKSLDGVRKVFDKQVKQLTQELFNNPPRNGVITTQFLLNHYQQVLPRFTHRSVVHLKQT